MFDLYTFGTPNGVKPVILLEELGAPYALKKVNVRQGEQRAPEFLALNPNGKVPVLIDDEGPDGAPITITESAAILIYLAERSGRFLAKAGEERVRAFEWLFFHGTAMGPAFGQSGYFQHSAPEKLPHAIERFDSEAKRTLGILDGRLARFPYVAGAEYSIADIANFGWIWRREFVGVTLDDTPHVAKWFELVAGRPAVRRAIAAVGA